MGRSLFFEVQGTPVPQGSMRNFTFGGRTVMTHASSKLRNWRLAVQRASSEAFREKFGVDDEGYDDDKLGGAIRAHLYFYLPRPRTVRRAWPSAKPDLDKLARGVFDALEAANVIESDARVVEFFASKKYADELEPHCRVYLEEIDEL